MLSRAVAWANTGQRLSSFRAPGGDGRHHWPVARAALRPRGWRGAPGAAPVAQGAHGVVPLAALHPGRRSAPEHVCRQVRAFLGLPCSLCCARTSPEHEATLVLWTCRSRSTTAACGAGHPHTASQCKRDIGTARGNAASAAQVAVGGGRAVGQGRGAAQQRARRRHKPAAAAVGDRGGVRRRRRRAAPVGHAPGAPRCVRAPACPHPDGGLPPPVPGARQPL